MTDDGPRELAIDLVWKGTRLTILVVHGDRPLHSDTVDPASATSRARAINKLKGKFPAIDFEELDQRLIDASTKRPPSAAGDAAGAGGSPALFANPEPWATAVSGSELLDEIVSLLNRFVVLPQHGAEVVALWILHTFVFDAFEFTARLLIWSPSMRCGKSRLLRLIAALVSRALSCEGITGPALFRSIEKYRPTMLIDEADTMLRGKETNEVLRGVINAGHQRGGKVIRCTGDDSEPKVFEVFAPIAIAMIGKPPGTIEDRSIPISMRRRMPGEKVDKFEPGRSLRDQFSALVQKCVRWSADERPRLMAARPSIPPGLDDRAADCWFSLLAIADIVGGSWPELARKVAVAVMSGRESGDSIGVELLRDIKVLFDNCESDQMSTASVIAALVQLEERPWSDYRRGHPINARQLAALLAAFSIRSRNARVATGVVKSYFRADFEDAWSRYLPDDGAPPPSGSATTLHTLDDKWLGPSPSATETDDVADGNSRNSLQNKGCSAVAAGAGGCHGRDELPVGPAMPCRPCGSPVYWRAANGPWTCVRCHPPLEGRAMWRWDANPLSCAPWGPTPPTTPSGSAGNGSGEPGRGPEGDEWYTPPDIIESARSTLGEIDLDPASNPIAQQNVRAKQFFSKEQNGLLQPWRGRVFTNPPYSYPLIEQFVAKLVAEVAAGNVTEAILLVNSQTSATWFQEAYRAASAVCFPRGRIRFLRPTGEAGPSPKQGQAILYFGPRAACFEKEFSKHGSITLLRREGAA